MQLEIITKVPQQIINPPSFLLIHGAWHGAWCWENFQDFFAENGYRSYALNLRGHGNSAGRQNLSRIRARDYVADIVQSVKRLPEAPILIGHSFGGYLVQKFLEQHTVPAAVLIAPVPVSGSLTMFLRLALRHPRAMIKCHLTQNPYALIETPCLARDAFFSTNLPEVEFMQHFARLQGESYRAGWDSIVFDLPRVKRVLPVPMLVLGAANDHLFSRTEIEATARAYHTHAEFFPDMAHDMMLEIGWKSVAERILDFVGQLSKV